MDNIPLDITLPTGQAKTVMPMIRDGHTVTVRLKSISKTHKADEKAVPGPTAGVGTTWEFVTTQPAPTSDGLEVNPGFPLFIRVPLYDRVESKKPGWFLEKIAKFQDALLGTGDVGNKKNKPPRPDFGPDCISAMIGKEMVAKISLRKDPNSDYEGNDIQTATFPGDLIPG